MSGYLLDSNVLINWLNGRAAAVAVLRRLSRELQHVAVNAVSLAETYSGLVEKDRERARKFVDQFDYWDIDPETARQAGALRYVYATRGRKLSVADTLLAAHALTQDATLVTENIRDFPMPELRVLRPE